MLELLEAVKEINKITYFFLPGAAISLSLILHLFRIDASDSKLRMETALRMLPL